MLAFSFKAFSTEADLAKGLLQFDPEDGEENDSTDMAAAEGESISRSESSSVLEKPLSSRDILAISMSGLARPLKSRILQVVATLARRPGDDDNDDAESDDGLFDDFEEEGSAMRTRITNLYEICGLLLFYNSVIEKGVYKLDSSGDAERDGQETTNPLMACLVNCLLESTKAYEATARAYGAMLAQFCSLTGETEALQVKSMLSYIADTRRNSPGFSTDVECPEDCRAILSIEWVTVVLVDAALSCCVTLEDALVLKKAVASVENAGLGAVASGKLRDSIHEKVTLLVDRLVESETSKVEEICGLGSLATAWRTWQVDDGAPMAFHPGLSQMEAEAAMKTFYASLYSPPLPSLETSIKDPQLRKSARAKIANHICSIYAKLYECMMSDSQGGYEDLSFLVHSPEQVKTLFSV